MKTPTDDSAPVDISDLVTELCTRLGHQAADVLRITLNLTEAELLIYLHDDQGSKFVHLNDNLAALGRVTIPVRA